jgi:DNA-binding beta-propeller fold protein YncE
MMVDMRIADKRALFQLLLTAIAVVFASLSLSAPGQAAEPALICSVGTLDSGDGEFQNPYGLAVDEVNGRVYVADTGNNKIRKFNLFGEYQNSFGASGSGDRQFLHPQGVGVDSANGDIYVVDTVNQRIQKFRTDGTNYTFLLKFGSFGNQNDQFNLPRDIAIDAQGNVYVCDSGNDRLSKFTSSGDFLAVIGQDDSLLNPYGIALDSSGNIYVADTENHRMVKCAPD